MKLTLIFLLICNVCIGQQISSIYLKDSTVPTANMVIYADSLRHFQLSIYDDTGNVFYYNSDDTSLMHIGDSLATIKWLIKTVIENMKEQKEAIDIDTGWYDLDESGGNLSYRSNTIWDQPLEIDSIADWRLIDGGYTDTVPLKGDTIEVEEIYDTLHIVDLEKEIPTEAQIQAYANADTSWFSDTHRYMFYANRIKHVHYFRYNQLPQCDLGDGRFCLVNHGYFSPCKCGYMPKINDILEVHDNIVAGAGLKITTNEDGSVIFELERKPEP